MNSFTLAKEPLMPAKKLQVVERNERIEAHPPDLGEHGLELWRSVQAQYQIDDAGGYAMLHQACLALDRAEACRAQIAEDGQVVRARGTIKDHPLLRHEVAARAFAVRTLARLGLDLEPIRSGPGRPPGRLGG
jgi:hypothetical protein